MHDSGPVPPCGARITALFAAGGIAGDCALASARSRKNPLGPPRLHELVGFVGLETRRRDRRKLSVRGGFTIALARAGAISTLRNARYCSTTDQAWRLLALDAAALSDGDPKTRRRDLWYPS
ncbi:hypothetical protein FQZ97_681620 [compost metagenome]